MPDIGETLRETRTRRRIDMTEVEAATKIRAKYLRALENEEWDLLPGPTFVKTFLRTYAEYLELDAKNLVEAYKQRYERPSTSELAPYTPVAQRRDRRPPRHGGLIISPIVVLVAGAVALLAAFAAIGLLWEDDPEPPAPTGSDAPVATSTPRGSKSSTRRSRARTVRLRVEATGTVEVCVIDNTGRRRVDARTLQAGQRTATYRSRRFRVTLGNGQAVLRINGHARQVPDRAEPIGYDIRPGRAPRELSAANRPVCS
jgi:cytoskeletal protein RodZ